MPKQNCWEFKKCGREQGGVKEKELGTCPAAVTRKADNLHGGKNGGRVCWAVAGTLCGGIVQGTFAMKVENCMYCEFYKLVLNEEGKNKLPANEILLKIKGDK